MLNLSYTRKKAIKERCRAWRIANRYTMQAIADNAGTSRQAIRSFETQSGCSSRIIMAYVKTGMPVAEIIDAAGIDLADLLGG